MGKLWNSMSNRCAIYERRRVRRRRAFLGLGGFVTKMKSDISSGVDFVKGGVTSAVNAALDKAKAVVVTGCVKLAQTQVNPKLQKVFPADVWNKYGSVCSEEVLTERCTEELER